MFEAPRFTPSSTLPNRYLRLSPFPLVPTAFKPVVGVVLPVLLDADAENIGKADGENEEEREEYPNGVGA